MGNQVKPVSSSELEAETERTVGGDVNSSRYFFFINIFFATEVVFLKKISNQNKTIRKYNFFT
jgi:hypothetical protein